MECWKDIKGYEGLYQVSDFGRVRSVAYRNSTETRELFLKKHNRGYLQVELANNGRRKTYMVHRLVAMAFVEGYRQGLVVNHIDENRRNNKASNLEWTTRSQNVKHSIALHPERYIRTSEGKVTQLSIEGSKVREWTSIIEIKKTLGYSDWSIRECCRGKRQTAYGYKWQYAY